MLKQADAQKRIAFSDAVADTAEIEQGGSYRALPAGINDADRQRPYPLSSHCRLVGYMSGKPIRQH